MSTAEDLPASSGVRRNAAGESLLQCLRVDCLNLVIARHGQRGGPPLEGYPGKSLTPMGHRQAARLARRVAQLPLDHLYCSDMARAWQTAEHVRKLRPDVPWDVFSDLRELARADQPDHYPAELTDEAREQLHQQRITRVARRICEAHKPGDVVLLVIHGGMTRRLLAELSGIRVEMFIAQHHASLTLASIDPKGKVVLRLANCTRHLLPSQITGDDLQ